MVAGAGGFVNHSRGLIGTGGKTEPDETEIQHSEYFRYFHFGGYFGGGFRINKPQKRIAIDVLPFNYHIGTNGFLEGHAKIELDIKL